MLYDVTTVMIAAGFATIAVVELFLNRLDNTWGGVLPFLRQPSGNYITIAFEGVAACLAGCIAFAVTMGQRSTLRGGKVLLAVAVATRVLGFFFSPFLLQ